MSASSTAISIALVSCTLQSMKRYVDLLSSYYLLVLFNRAFIILYRYNSTDYAFSTNTILKATNQHRISPFYYNKYYTSFLRYSNNTSFP